MLFPVELDGESLYSLISRLSIINSLSPTDLKISQKKSLYSRAADIEMDFSCLASWTSETYGTKEELEKKYLPKYQLKDVDKYCLIELSNKNKNIWKWCKQCSTEDETSYGIAYWHKLHQLPCVVACEKHHTPLLEINIPFRERQSRFILPMQAYKMKHYPACKNEHLHTAIALSHIEKRLADAVDVLFPELLKSMFDSKLHSNNGSNHLKHIISVISNGQPLIESHIENLLGHTLISEEYIAVLIHSVYGEFDLFVNNYNWNQAMCNGVSIRPTIKSLGIRETHRAACETYISSTCESTRTGFWKSSAKSAKWLSRYDSEWLDLKLPVMYKATSQSLQTQFKLFN